jgi:hypothetical protein
MRPTNCNPRRRRTTPAYADFTRRDDWRAHAWLTFGIARDRLFPYNQRRRICHARRAN